MNVPFWDVIRPNMSVSSSHVNALSMCLILIGWWAELEMIDRCSCWWSRPGPKHVKWSPILWCHHPCVVFRGTSWGGGLGIHCTGYHIVPCLCHCLLTFDLTTEQDWHSEACGQSHFCPLLVFKWNICNAKGWLYTQMHMCMIIIYMWIQISCMYKFMHRVL